jgi:hypothetical protein
LRPLSIAAFVFLILVSASSSYGQLKAKALADMCAKDAATAQSTSDAFDALTCSAYVSGWMHGIGGTMIQVDGRYFIIDFAEGVTAKQLVRVFVKHVKEHPEEEIKAAEVGLTDAAGAARLFTFGPLMSHFGAPYFVDPPHTRAAILA